jgi:hypothetical protein
MMPGIISVLLLVVAMAPRAAAQSTPKPAPTVAGKWNVALETPHGKVTMNLELKLEGKKVTGTLRTEQQGPFPLAGECAEGKLTFAVTEDGADLSFAGRWKDADTILGVLSNQHGDLTGIATRVKDKNQ